VREAEDPERQDEEAADALPGRGGIVVVLARHEGELPPEPSIRRSAVKSTPGSPGWRSAKWCSSGPGVLIALSPPGSSSPSS
jgi:hypothetical protein